MALCPLWPVALVALSMASRLLTLALGSQIHQILKLTGEYAVPLAAILGIMLAAIAMTGALEHGKKGIVAPAIVGVLLNVLFLVAFAMGLTRV